MVNGLAAKVQYDFPDWLSQPLFADTPGRYFVDAFLDWSASLPGEEPWATCISLIDAHHPYVPDAEMDQWNDDDAREIQALLNNPVWPFLRD